MRRRFLGSFRCRLGARRGQGQFPNYENVIPKAPLEARVVFQREELLDGLTKLSATARKAQNAAVKLELSKSPACVTAENDGTANRVAFGARSCFGNSKGHRCQSPVSDSVRQESGNRYRLDEAISEGNLRSDCV